MGRLPAEWAGRRITARFPYVMDGELTLTPTQTGVQFPEATFMHSTDKPFEIHRMIPRLYSMSDAGVLNITQPDQDELAGLMRLTINNLGLNQLITKTPTLVGLLTKGSSERTWEWADPMYLLNSHQIQVICDVLTFPVFTQVMAGLKIGLSFEGYQIVIAPASENR